MNGLVAEGCHFQAFWVGSKPSKSTFLIFLELNNKMKKHGKSGNRNFGGDILSISTENRNFDRNFRNFFPCLQDTYPCQNDEEEDN